MVNLVMLIIDTNQVNQGDFKHQCYNQIYMITRMHILLLKELLTFEIQIIMSMIRNCILKAMRHSLAVFLKIIILSMVMQRT